MKTWWIRTTLFASLLAGAVTVALTCGGGDWEEPFLFMPEASGVPDGYAPFFYTGSLYYAFAEPYYREADLVADWRGYVRGEVPDGDIYAFLAKLEPVRFFAAVDSDRWAGHVQPVAEAGLWRWAVDKKDVPLQEYLIFCKEVEQSFGAMKDGWTTTLDDAEMAWYNYDRLDPEGGAVAFPAPKPALARLDAKAVKTLSGKLPPFLRERYIYQRLLLNYYQGSHTQVTQLYKAHFGQAGAPRQIHQWARYFAALSERELGNAALADLYLAEVFVKSAGKRRTSFEHFSGDDQAWALARTPAQKASLLVIGTAGNPGYVEAPLRRVLDLAGPSDGLALLVAREIGKIEQQSEGMLRVPHPGERDNDRQTREHDWAHARHLEGLCREAAAKAAPAHRPGFVLMQAHLMLLQQKRACEPLLARVLADGYADPVQKEQARIDQLILVATGQGPLNLQEREALANNLGIGGETTLQQNVERAILLRGDTMAFQLVQYMAGVGAAGPDEPKKPDSEPAEDSPKKEKTEEEKRWDYFSSTFVRKNSLPQDPWAFFQYVKAHPQDPICRRIMNKVPMLETWARDWQGSYLAFTGKLEEAEAMLKPLPDQYLDMYRSAYYLDEDPTQVVYFHNHGTHILPMEKRYTKLTYVQKMLELKRKAESSRSDEAARAWLALGNMAYNMGYNGNSWSMVSTYWSGTGPFMDGPLKSLLEDDYVSGANAEPYYRKAMLAAKDPKLGAVAALMLGRTNLESASAIAEGWEYDQGKVDTAFAELYQRYPKLAPELVSNCEAMGQFLR